MGTTFNASVAPDIMAPAANRSHPLAPIIHVKTVEHALLMGMTTNVNVHSCTLETTVNMDAHHHVTTTLLLIMFHLNEAIVFSLLHVLVVILQTLLEKLFVSVLAEIVNGIQTELHIPKQFNVQHRRHPFLLLRRKKRQQLQRQAQRLQQHQQQLRQQHHRDKPQRNRDQSMQQRQRPQRERLPPQEKLQPQYENKKLPIQT